MSEDPFGDLDAAMGSGETDSGPEPESEPADEDAGTDDAVESDDEAATESASAEPVDPRERPAFEFDETVHKALYVLEAVADEFDDIITYDVERELTRDHGLKGVTKSELHNAALAVATEHPEEIVERVLEQRGVDDEDSE
ncbi:MULTISPECIES: hypothetical protein [Haloferax]|jgi:hypothetical protein|uniref:hypothetical protein n=1 Tax=Haloferax TaxID=2251 RepID=UPI000E2339D6|nr:MULTISPECIES: hypothetical protein [Haloferax]RDZ34217.1 hypothetical protein C5B88_16485 [Haloferax sp. Atlit-24N]RLM36079.1 hypothetical protein DVK03_14940 [Haloferax sp. Atlit-109R]RLM41717.1 hypothetical protein DVK04_15425 [Haloferax sp. Atlit-105R]